MSRKSLVLAALLPASLVLAAAASAPVSKPAASGNFEATVYVATDGSVLAAGVTPPDEAGESDVDCLVSTLKAATLPSPGSWPAKVTFSL